MSEETFQFYLPEPTPPPVPPPAGPPAPRPSSGVMVTFRDTLRKISPPWLQTGTAEKILYAIGVHIDGFADAVIAGVKMRFPGYYSLESLPLIGRERRIARGRYDTDETYQTRLLRWLDDHRRRGGPYALLQQLFAHFHPNNIPTELVYMSGRRYTMDLDGAITRDDIAFTPPDGSPPEKWSQWWLFYDWPDPVAKRVWGTMHQYGDGTVWGSELTSAEVRDLRLVPREWNAMHAIGHLILRTPPPGDDVPVSIG
jgi:hypothetical protein